ncbi:uncharacterized protein LOC123537489 isoform X2 [Mercenaria mercenaria]|uniref:uncharacterized protein LOC123537489 isoform X2 n=1 Tax=Mercenaria mercenaria TaxID=6596 RepID=UPI00234F8C3E|nr:uncharacterized protein LOC123537489 isoform X2 [Mercenaria mercenaria]
MDKKPSGLSLITNGSVHGNGNISPFPNGARRDSVDLSPMTPISPDEKQLFPGVPKKRTKFQRVRKRLNILLHTHIALITVCVLSSLDAICVIGQVICDILIMSEKLSDFDKLHERASDILVDVLPDYFNHTNHSGWSFEEMIDHIEKSFLGGTSSRHISPRDVRENSSDDNTVSLITNALLQSILSRSVRSASSPSSGDPSQMAAGGGDHGHGEHSLAYEFTHSFHIGSMALLSALLLETFLKIFAMGKHFLNHKLEIFDAFVIMVSWCLDVAFWEGIWARPGQEGATLLIFILPWRVIRIVNSFVLVIQEKDLVLLKVVKQRLRFQLRKDKESTAKLDKYRLEVRQLQGLCRKHGADENAIQACCPTGRRRRSSLFQSLTSLASVALVSAMGSSPKLEPDNVSSSESEDELDKELKEIPRTDSTGSDMSVKFVLSPEPEDVEFEIKVQGEQNEAFTFDEKEIQKYNKSEEGNKKPEGLITKL